MKTIVMKLKRLLIQFSTLRFRLALLFSILLAATAFIFSFLTAETMKRHMLKEIIKKAESLSRVAASLASYSILSRDLLGIDTIVHRVRGANGDVDYVAVTDNSMKIIAHSDVALRGETFSPAAGTAVRREPDGMTVSEVAGTDDRSYEVMTPVVFRNKRIGYVIVGMNTSALPHAYAETRRNMLTGLAFVVALGVGCVAALSSLITKPIEELKRGVAGLKAGTQTAPLRIYAHDELGNLTRSFNLMAETITNQKVKLASHARELEIACMSTVKVLAAAIDARDPYTHGHSTRVAQLSLRIGEALELPQDELSDLETACLFHDVGKLKTPDGILQKNRGLVAEEYREIIAHCDDGAAILGRAPSLHKYIPAVRHHHEWFNGEGYPDGLSGDEIPLHAAIIAVADAYDAMTSTRPYRNALPKEIALREIARNAGRQFHPRIVDVFMKVVQMDVAAGKAALVRM
jgi:putative nucleotidyltransferase with HDIG domain